MSAELKPCPFCGSKEIDPRGWASTDSAGPACDDCGAATGDVGDTLEENIRLWNTRAPQWLPIESAEAATPVLTYGADGMKIAFYYDGSWVEQSGDDLFVIEVPTHWQPLPAAPEVE